MSRSIFLWNLAIYGVYLYLNIIAGNGRNYLNGFFLSSLELFDVLKKQVHIPNPSTVWQKFDSFQEVFKFRQNSHFDENFSFKNEKYDSSFQNSREASNCSKYILKYVLNSLGFKFIRTKKITSVVWQMVPQNGISLKYSLKKKYFF